MRTELLTTWPAVRALAPEWNPLLQRTNANTIFLTWEWIVSWLEAIDEQVKPFVITVRDDSGRLVGIAPFYVLNYRLLRTVPYRVLRILGDYPTGAEYGDLIADETAADEVMQSLLKALVRWQGEWDCVWMPNMNGWNGAADRLAQLCRDAGMYVHRRAEEFSSFRLPKTWNEYLNMLSQRKRYQVRQETKRLSAEPTAETKRCANASEIGTFLKALNFLHHSRWQTVGELGSFVRKPAEAEFYRRFVPRAFEQGWLRFYGLRINSEFRAIQIGYVYSNVFHSLQEGFDGESFKGAGNALRADIIRACIEEGVEEYDFLGGMSDHKRRWAADARLGAQLFAGHRSAKNSLLFAKTIWPTGRYLRPEVNLGTISSSGGRKPSADQSANVEPSEIMTER